MHGPTYIGVCFGRTEFIVAVSIVDITSLSRLGGSDFGKPLLTRSPLKAKTHPELRLSPWQSSGEAEGLAGRELSGPVHVERWSKVRSYDVVDLCIVYPVGEVESFCCEEQTRFLTEFEPSAQAHVEVEVIRTSSAVARSTWGAIVREVAIAINVRSRQKVEGMTAVVGHN